MQKAKEDLNFEFRVLLQGELSRRMRANERYSVRAFASYLELDSSTVSQILAGKRSLSEKKIKLLCDKIGIVIPSKSNDCMEFTAIDLDSFAIISDWYHFAILDLTLLKTFRNDVNWITRKLSIQPFEALRAIERMKRMGLLSEHSGTLRKAKGFYSNYSEGTTSAALKEYQRQVIKKALQSVDDCPQELKDITSITIAADSRKLATAKEKIKKFRRELCSFLETDEGDSVYHLTLQLYPVTKFDT